MKMKHVTIHTDKFDDTLKFYTEECELKVIRDDRPNRDLIFLGDSPDMTLVEIIGEETVGQVGTEHFRIAFLVEDVAAKRDEMIAKGFAVTDIRWLTEKRGFFFVHDPRGVKVQFIN